MNFWKQLYKLKRPVVGLSPMDGVTDAPFRYMVAKYGKRKEISKKQVPNSKLETKGTETLNSNDQMGGVDVIFTEFVSVDALHFASGDPSTNSGLSRRERLLRTFTRAKDVDAMRNDPSTSRDHPFKWPYEIAQVFGTKPDYFKEAAELIESLGFDGIDINMGCPSHKVEENGAGAGLIRTPKLAQEIVKAVKSATSLPVSVKTRIGVDHEVVEAWMETLMEVEPANISLHGRTLRQLYQGSADWEAIGRAAVVVHKHTGHILGNGDIQSIQDLRIKMQEYGVDGGLIGRAAEGNPAIFVDNNEPNLEQRIAWMLEHARVFERVFAERDDPLNSTLKDHPFKWFLPMRKHLAWYCRGFPGAVEVRSKLMQANSASEVEKIIQEMI